MRKIATIDELRSLLNQEIGVSAWMVIDQPRINLFAEATGDHQWIHLDAERCSKESPFGVPIAHGFLALSLLPMLMEQTVQLPAAKMFINYGLNKVRFPSPLLVNSKIRACITLMALDDIADGVQITWLVVIETEGGTKPVCAAELIGRLYF